MKTKTQKRILAVITTVVFLFSLLSTTLAVPSNTAMGQDPEITGLIEAVKITPNGNGFTVEYNNNCSVQPIITAVFKRDAVFNSLYLDKWTSTVLIRALYVKGSSAGKTIKFNGNGKMSDGVNRFAPINSSMKPADINHVGFYIDGSVEETPEPTVEPTNTPTVEPTPTEIPTEEPTTEPTPEITVEPTDEPMPEITPSPELTPEPTITVEPTEEVTPTIEPTETPVPTEEPTTESTIEPSEEVTPTPEITPEPTIEPTVEPTPTQTPTIIDELLMGGLSNGYAGDGINWDHLQSPTVTPVPTQTPMASPESSLVNTPTPTPITELPSEIPTTTTTTEIIASETPESSPTVELTPTIENTPNPTVTPMIAPTITPTNPVETLPQTGESSRNTILLIVLGLVMVIMGAILYFYKR